MFKVSKMIIIAASLVLSPLVTGSLGSANAQSAGATGNNITQSFQLRDVLTKRGKITIGTDVASTLEFDSEVVEWAIGRDDLLIEPVKSKANPGLLYLRAKATQGTSSLDIMLESGELTRWTFTINSKLSEGQRYIVKSPVSAPTSAETANSNPSSAGSLSSLPDWLSLEWRANQSAAKDVTVSYQLDNKSSNTVTTDANKLLLFANKDGKPRKVAYTLSRTSSNGGSNYALAASATQTGTLNVKAKDLEDATELTAQWTLVDNGSKISYLNEKKLVLNAPQTYARIPVNIPETVLSPVQSSSAASLGAATPSTLEGTPMKIVSTSPVQVNNRADRPTNIELSFTLRQFQPTGVSFEVVINNQSDHSISLNLKDVRVNIHLDSGIAALVLALPFTANPEVAIAPGEQWSKRLQTMTIQADTVEYRLTLKLLDGQSAIEYQRSVVL